MNIIIERKKQLFIRFLKEYNIYKQFIYYFNNDILYGNSEYNNFNELIEHIIQYNNKSINKYNSINLPKYCKILILESELEHAFIWDNTKENKTFWNNINNKWMKINHYLTNNQ